MADPRIAVHEPVSRGSGRRPSERGAVPEPASRVFGLDRGTPIDRFYIETFLARHADAIRGRVLEAGDATYTRRFGEGRATKSDVLHVAPGNPRATIVGDLSTGRGIPSDAFDCLILTQTLHCIYDIRAAVAVCRGALRPGGVLLATMPGISQISRYDYQRWGDYWRLTTLAARRLFEECFGPAAYDVHAFGNVETAKAFLDGRAAEELSPEALQAHDPDYELLIAVRAVRGGQAT